VHAYLSFAIRLWFLMFGVRAEYTTRRGKLGIQGMAAFSDRAAREGKDQVQRAGSHHRYLIASPGPKPGRLSSPLARVAKKGGSGKLACRRDSNARPTAEKANRLTSASAPHGCRHQRTYDRGRTRPRAEHCSELVGADIDLAIRESRQAVEVDTGRSDY